MSRVKKVHEAIYLIDPVIKLQIIFRIIFFVSQLLRVSRETIGSMPHTWNVDESEVEEKDRDNPMVDASQWCNVRVEHSVQKRP